ncbi:MAG: TolC family outer membrane protein [Thauera sp.]|jgi:protease secretion system outer membrane protein
MIRLRPRPLALLLALAACPLPALAAGAFGTAFDAARTHDAEYLAARHELAAGEELAPIARAGLLPTITASYSESRVRGEREFPAPRPPEDLDYRNPVAALQLRAPLLNLEARSRYHAALAQTDSARARFAAGGRDLLDRLGLAYVQRLFAEESLTLAHVQVDALAVQTRIAQRRLGAGEGTRTEAADAAASHASARAELIQAQDQRELAQRTLGRITGDTALTLRTLAADAAPLLSGERTLQDWIALGSERNPALEARRREIDALRHEVRRSRAGHYPRVDLIASAVNAENESISSLDQETRQYSIGVQVNIPIYAGGGVDATVRRAAAELARTEAQLENEMQALKLDIQRQFQQMESGRARLDSLTEAVDASALALQGAQRGMSTGVLSSADVLDALRRHHTARRDAAQARHELLLARLRLQSLAGLAVEEIVADIDSLLTVELASTGR